MTNSTVATVVDAPVTHAGRGISAVQMLWARCGGLACARTARGRCEALSASLLLIRGSEQSKIGHAADVKTDGKCTVGR